MTMLEQIRAVQGKLGLRVDGYAGVKTWAAVYGAICDVPGGASGMTPGAGVLPKTGAVGAPMDLGELDERTRGCLAGLLPEVQTRALAFVKEVRGKGIDVRIIDGLRTYQEQALLYEQGRTTAGKIVTNAPAGHSNHNFGLAFDVGIFRNGRYLDEDAVYREIAPIGKAHGLTWGGDWQSIQDEPHYELRPAWASGMSESAMLAELRRRKADGKDLLS